MALLCFLLDLRSIPPPLLRDLKQYLLQLANLYAVSSGRGGVGETKPLRDRIGLCYLHQSRAAPSSELKIAYRPGGNFHLRDIHHAINCLPMDSFLPEFNESMTSGSEDQEFPLVDLLCNNALFSWVDEDVLKKVVVISSSIFTYTEALRKCLVDAADRYIAVEFVVLEQQGMDLQNDISEKINTFISKINDLENCGLRRYIPDTSILCGLVKGWLQEIKNEVEEPLQAVFLFGSTILGSINKIFCDLFASSYQVIDGFASCQTCRCHGIPIDVAADNNSKRSCSVTCSELKKSDVIENAVRICEETVLFLPSFEGCPKLQRISSPITFTIMERTSLASLNEGVILGTSYVVTPSACHEIEGPSDDCDISELNNQNFQGLCRALFLLDQGLVCSSTCNTETMLDGTFQCFYVLQPSDKGPMLLRRLAGSEEILPIPDLCPLNNLVLPHEIESSVQASLLKIDLKDYNPLNHERGFHTRLNWLVKESLQFGSIRLQGSETSPKADEHPRHQPSLLQQPLTQALEKGINPNENKEGETLSPVTTEWEQLLIIDDMNDNDSPLCDYKPQFQNPILSTQSKILDERTSKILQRLEPPKQQKPKAYSPSISTKLISGQMKKPLLPFDSSSSSSQPMRPNFQKLKRKQR